MNLDSRLLVFPLYICCNFLYTSPEKRRENDGQWDKPASWGWLLKRLCVVTFIWKILMPWKKRCEMVLSIEEKEGGIWYPMVVSPCPAGMANWWDTLGANSFWGIVSCSSCSRYMRLPPHLSTFLYARLNSWNYLRLPRFLLWILGPREWHVEGLSPVSWQYRETLNTVH